MCSNHQDEYINDVIVDYSFGIISHGTNNNNNNYGNGSGQGSDYSGDVVVIAVVIFIVSLCSSKS